eukprot:g2290.t1
MLRRALADARSALRRFELIPDVFTRHNEAVIWDASRGAAAANAGHLQERWVTSDDREVGGRSECDVQILGDVDSHDVNPCDVLQEQSATSDRARLCFSGSVSLDTSGNPNLAKSGYCAARLRLSPHTQARMAEFDGGGLAVRMRSDGRTYHLTVATDSFFDDDLYQGFLVTPRGEWVTAQLPWSQLLLTGRGYIKAVQREIDPCRVQSLGFTLADGYEGPFKLEIAWIKAVRELDPELRARTDWEGICSNAHMLGRTQIKKVGRRPDLPDAKAQASSIVDAEAEKASEGEMLRATELRATRPAEQLNK